MHLKFHFTLISQKGINFRLMSGSSTVPLTLWKPFGGEKPEPPDFFQFSHKTVATHESKNQHFTKIKKRWLFLSTAIVNLMRN